MGKGAFFSFYRPVPPHNIPCRVRSYGERTTSLAGVLPEGERERKECVMLFEAYAGEACGGRKTYGREGALETAGEGGPEMRSAFASVQAAQMGKNAGSDPFRQGLPVGGDCQIRGFLRVRTITDLHKDTGDIGAEQHPERTGFDPSVPDGEAFFLHDGKGALLDGVGEAAGFLAACR